MTDFREFTKASRRLAELRLLNDSGGAANESVIHTALTTMLGFTQTSRNDVREDLKWLKERLLVDLDRLDMAGDRVLLVARITIEGQDAAAGRGAPIEGLQRPAIAG
jgi:hypothetical protein